MKLFALLALAACGAPDVPSPNCAPLEPPETCCGAVSGLPRCFNGRPYTCEPLPECYEAHECGIGGLKNGRLVFLDGGCQE